jgi:Tfp pilus assembly protein PilO
MNKIESYLNTTDTRQKYLIYFMIFGLIFYIFVQGLMPLLESRDTLQNSVETLQLKLSRNSLGKLKGQLAQKNRELLSLKSKQEKQKEDIDFFISGLYKLKYAFYDDKEWAKSIEDILTNSLKRNLKIDYIKSRDVKEPKNKDILKKKKTLEISGSGNYIDIVAFISYIDNLNTLLQFTSTKIDLADKELKFKLLIDMYGIGL